MSDFWFKPKTHGYGAAPTGWKGWALTLGVVFVNLAIVAALLAGPLMAGDAPSVGRFVLLFVLETLLIIGFLIIARKKTDGDWRWRWGKG